MTARGLIGFRERYRKAIAITQKGDSLGYQFFVDSDAVNFYLESLADKTGVMERNSNLEDIFVRLTKKLG